MPCSNSVSGGRSLSRSDTLPNSVSVPVRMTSALALPLTTWVPIDSALVRWPSGVSAGKHRDRFLYRIGLARQGRFIDEEIFGFQDQTVSGDDISGVQNDDVSGDNLFDGNFLGASIAKYRSLDLHDGEQLFHCFGCAVLLPKPEKAAYEDNGEDDESV